MSKFPIDRGLLERRIQIEEALSRVRARALSMHRSEDILKVTATMFDEYLLLGMPAIRCGIGIVHDITDGEAWATTFTPQGVVVQVTGHVSFLESPIYRALYDAWARQERWFKFRLEKESLKRFLQAIFPDFEIPGYSPAFPESQIINYFGFPQGGLYVVTVDDLTEDQVDLLKRFTEVFHLTYTRYQDILQAEEQRKEIECKASVDRVRAEISQMRHAGDLKRIPPLIWRELRELNVPLIRCGVFIPDEDKAIIRSYLSNPEGESLAVFELPYESSDLAQHIVSSWKARQLYTTLWGCQTFLDWVAAMQAKGYIATNKPYPGQTTPPETLAIHLVPFEQGMLYVGTREFLGDSEMALVKSLAAAFSAAYVRYEDFQRLDRTNAQLAAMLEDLERTQQQLVQSEKLASLGQLTAGIAHEIKNPLNFVNNFGLLISEMVEELEGAPEARIADLQEVLELLKVNAQKVNEHGKRADRIVHAMMQHASGATGERQRVDLSYFVDEYVNLAFYGKKAQNPSLDIELVKNYDRQAGPVEIIPQEIGQVLVNLLNNAFDAMLAKRALRGADYIPRLEVVTRKKASTFEIAVMDNGTGVSEQAQKKVFEPFFTTKRANLGTGLGLSLSYDIITKGHGGSLTLESIPGEGATFTVGLPVSG